MTDIIIDDSPAPMEVEELPNVHDCEWQLFDSPMKAVDNLMEGLVARHWN